MSGAPELFYDGPILMYGALMLMYEGLVLTYGALEPIYSALAFIYGAPRCLESIHKASGSILKPFYRTHKPSARFFDKARNIRKPAWPYTLIYNCSCIYLLSDPFELVGD